jgi:L-ascorbate metabolism protein UlaG (beta-lactamase superfamily)
MSIFQRNIVQITLIGHATALINFDGQRILTDPWFNDPIHLVCRHKYPLGITLDKLPAVDLLALSHCHRDHFDTAAIERLNRSATVVIPNSETHSVQGFGFCEVVGLDHWQSWHVGEIMVTALPAVHPVSENCYIFQSGGKTVFFGADTQIFPEMSEVGKNFDVDVALLPISGLVFYGGRLGLVRRICMSPSQAAEAALKLKAKAVIPIHYHISCFLPFFSTIISPGTPQQFSEQMRNRAPGIRVVVLNTGQVWEA